MILKKNTLRHKPITKRLKYELLYCVSPFWFVAVSVCRRFDHRPYTWYSGSSWNTTSDALRYGMCSQGKGTVLRCYLHIQTFIRNRNEPYQSVGRGSIFIYPAQPIDVCQFCCMVLKHVRRTQQISNHCSLQWTEYFLKFSVPWPKTLIWKLAVISEYIL